MKLGTAVFEEAAKKSSLVWVRGTRATAPRPVWHVWHDRAVLVVGDGPGEQPLHGLAARAGGPALVTVRSKDKGGRLATLPVRVERLEPRSEAWDEAVEQLRGKRLNSPDHADVPARWARECTVLRLVPEEGAEPEQEAAGAEEAAPLATPATTGRGLPPRRRRRRAAG